MFKDKVCIITGGANGIGRTLVEKFYKLGAKVAFIDIDKKAGDDLIKKLDSSCLFYFGDISQKEVLEDFSKQIINKYQTIDYLINNAMASKKGILSDCSYADFNYCLNVGITAPYMLTNLFKNIFKQNAAIVNISSTRAYMSQSDTESYTAQKGGILALTHALAISLAGRVRVNSISPGWIDTSKGDYPYPFSKADLSQHPVKRVGKPIDIFNMVKFLCSNESSFITGQDFVVDGGMTKQMIYHNDEDWQKN